MKGSIWIWSRKLPVREEGLILVAGKTVSPSSGKHRGSTSRGQRDAPHTAEYCCGRCSSNRQALTCVFLHAQCFCLCFFVFPFNEWQELYQILWVAKGYFVFWLVFEKEVHFDLLGSIADLEHSTFMMPWSGDMNSKWKVIWSVQAANHVMFRASWHVGRLQGELKSAPKFSRIISWNEASFFLRKAHNVPWFPFEQTSNAILNRLDYARIDCSFLLFWDTCCNAENKQGHSKLDEEWVISSGCLW